MDEQTVKLEFKKILERNGFKAEITKEPADISATKDGVQWWFEIKYTLKDDSYYGGSTETEWQKAFEHQDHYRFVVIQTDERGRKFDWEAYSPQEFLKICRIPPFHITFNIPLPITPRGKQRTEAEKLQESPKLTYKKPTRKIKSIPLTKEIFEKIHDVYSSNRAQDE